MIFFLYLYLLVAYDLSSRSLETTFDIYFGLVAVGNIPYDATEEQLIQICELVGPVVSFRSAAYEKTRTSMSWRSN